MRGWCQLKRAPDEPLDSMRRVKDNTLARCVAVPGWRAWAVGFTLAGSPV